jgi:tetratricopeptide (TPR) repeat protein
VLTRRFPELAETVRKIQVQARRVEIERLQRQAKADGNLESWTAIGNAYLELYQAEPKGGNGDELLYNAGIAFEEGRETAAVIRALTLLSRQHPKSALAPRALARLGRIYGNIAQYDKAAETLEDYAKRYAGEKDAYDALSDAIYFRKALGDRAAVIANTGYFIKTYGAKNPRESAEASWSLTTLYDADPDSAIKHLRDYLRLHAKKGEPGRVVIAHGKLGVLLWNQSCPHAGTDGLCVKVTSRATTCSPGAPVPAWTVTSRHAGKQKDALAAFALAIEEYERRGVTDDPAAAYHYAQARLALADAELESFLTLEFPSGLSFDPGDPGKRSASMQRFRAWFETMMASGGKVTRAYETVLVTKEPASSITAAARLGIVSDSFASRLVSGEVPRDLRTGPHAADKLKTYCSVVQEAAEPLAQRALEAYAGCLLKSTELSWFGESSAYCERELVRRMPKEYPAAREVRPHATFVAPVLASEPGPPSRR